MGIRLKRFIRELALGILLVCRFAVAGQDCADCTPARVGLPVSTPLGSECQLPEPGASREHSPAVVYGFPPDNSYRIKRLPDISGKPQLEATIKINFTAEPTLVQAMREKVRFCYSALSPGLRGPNGEQLVLRLAEDNENLQPMKVRVNGCFLQESSDCYSMHSECSVIVHEALHLLGLVDEYSNPEFDCRSVGTRPSMMNDEIPWVDQALDHCEQEGCLVKGEAKDFKSCSKPIRTLKEWNKVLTPHWKFVMEHPGARDLPDSRFVLRSEVIGKKCDREARVTPFGDGYTLISRPVKDLPPKVAGSLLLPVQFYKMVYPKCKALNENYDDCMKNAYRSSKREGCLKVSPQCQNGEWLGQ